MEFNSRSIYGCTEAPAGFMAPSNSLLTYNPGLNRLYIHLLAYPMGSVVLKDMASKVKYIQFLHDASEIKFRKESDGGANDLVLDLPVLKPNSEIPVLEVYLK
jgi:alpha-L-fucosidase